MNGGPLLNQNGTGLIGFVSDGCIPFPYKIEMIKKCMTYKQAQIVYEKRYDSTVKTCWIADIKSKNGKTRMKAPNRIGKNPKYPCPKEIRPKLEKILKELKMI